MCFRVYRQYTCCSRQCTMGWHPCEEKPPALNCPQAQAAGWQEPYAVLLGYIHHPCWDCMWAAKNDGGKAKREFLQKSNRAKTEEDPWVSDEERKEKVREEHAIIARRLKEEERMRKTSEKKRKRKRVERSGSLGSR